MLRRTNFALHASPSANRAHSRKGVSAVESAVVLGIIVVAALASIYSLGSKANRSFASVGRHLGDETAATTISRGTHEAKSIALAQSDTTLAPTKDRTAEVAVAVCVSSLIVIGVLYMRLWRRRTGDLKRNEEAVDEIRKRTVALCNVLSKRNSIFNRIDDNWESILGGRAIVGTYMSTSVVSIPPDTPKAEALQKMEDAGFRRFIVRHDDKSLAGVVSRKDILSKPGELVSDVMTDNPKTATPQCEIHTALSILLENRISCLPIVKNNVLVGLLSVSDLLMVLQCLLRDLSTREIDPEFVAAQAMNDRCELVPETTLHQPSQTPVNF